jgi:NADH-quinone oxidoreductase subunit I
MTIILKKERRPMNLLERLYFIEIFRGMSITIRHFFKNLIFIDQLPTIQYPDEHRSRSENFRGIHVINRREDGSVKCVACMMCETICPADCITIEAGESPDPAIEKLPVRFEIDLLRCIFCGYCVDACPKEALFMTGEFERVITDPSRSTIDLIELSQRASLQTAPKGYRPVY